MKTTTQPGVLSRMPLATLGQLTTIALFGSALAFAILQILIGVLVLPLLIITIIDLIVTAIVASGIRWAPLPGALFGLGTIVGGLFSQQYMIYHLTHPEQVGAFTVSVLIYVFDVIALGAGIGATLQNYGYIDRRAPNWLGLPLAALVGFVIGAVVVATMVPPLLSSTPASATATPGVVHMSIANFTQNTVTIAKGSSLQLVDNGTFPHILANGTWQGNTPHPERESGAPAVNNIQVNGGTTTIGPFNTAGTYSIYCSIHPGMTLKVVVQ
ncbi:MAG TPA: plastocyanin/azurin family copper-binding protein [Ktedonosporobacter sp.]|nr:plastocyanin/azurin family copper-binding protein [Ktedonosporobacter sp.]